MGGKPSKDNSSLDIPIFLGSTAVFSVITFAILMTWIRRKRRKRREKALANANRMGGSGGTGGSGGGSGPGGGVSSSPSASSSAVPGLGIAGVGYGLVEEPVLAEAGPDGAVLGDGGEAAGGRCDRCGDEAAELFGCATCKALDRPVCRKCREKALSRHGHARGKLAHLWVCISASGRAGAEEANSGSLLHAIAALSSLKKTVEKCLPLDNETWQRLSRAAAGRSAEVPLMRPNRLVELPLDLPESRGIISDVEGSCLPIHGKQLRVARVQRVENSVVEVLFHARRSELMDPEAPVSRLFHGTSAGASMSIARDGFRLPTVAKHGGMYGRGVYFAIDSSKSERYTHGDDLLLVCDVALGRRKVVLASDEEVAALEGEDVFVSGFDSIHAPKDTKELGGVLNDEMIVFHPFQARVTHVVTFKREIFLIDPPVMAPLHDAHACRNCQKHFSWTVWRHHCAYCGLVFCDDCLPIYAFLNELRGVSGVQRICTRCNNKRAHAQKIAKLVPKIKAGGDRETRV